MEEFESKFLAYFAEASYFCKLAFDISPSRRSLNGFLNIFVVKSVALSLATSLS